jgi:hypothetical protein
VVQFEVDLLALDGWLIAHANKVNALRPSRK